MHFEPWWSKTITTPPACFLQQMNSIIGFRERRRRICLVALTVFEVSCGNFITRILSRISGACWKLLMTDVSPLCHTPCIIWFGKQHTVFCSISMSQTVCKQLVITQFSENHYFPMKCWSRSKLCFGMASAPIMRSAGCCRYAGAHGEPGTNKARCQWGDRQGEGRGGRGKRYTKNHDVGETKKSPLMTQRTTVTVYQRGRANTGHYLLSRFKQTARRRLLCAKHDHNVIHSQLL